MESATRAGFFSDDVPELAECPGGSVAPFPPDAIPLCVGEAPIPDGGEGVWVPSAAEVQVETTLSRSWPSVRAESVGAPLQCTEHRRCGSGRCMAPHRQRRQSFRRNGVGRRFDRWLRGLVNPRTSTDPERKRTLQIRPDIEPHHPPEPRPGTAARSKANPNPGGRHFERQTRPGLQQRYGINFRSVP